LSYIILIGDMYNFRYRLSMGLQ